MIAPFPLGERDVSDRFLVPQKLYGRAAESRRLARGVRARGRHAARRSSCWSPATRASASRRWCTSCTGRSSAKRGLFVAGKFEQYKRDVPYFTIVQAFREVMLDILAESADSVAAWRQRIQAALGQNGQLIVDLIPQLELVIGPQPPVPELSLGEAENRLRMVLRQFVGVFATQEHPLAAVPRRPAVGGPGQPQAAGGPGRSPRARGTCSLIGAYRDNEVGPAHPLMRALDEARAQGAAIQRPRAGAAAGSTTWASSSPTRCTARAGRRRRSRSWCTRRRAATPSSSSSS